MPEFDLHFFKEILPQLIREDDAVKGAIITALSGVVATREDIRDLIAEMDQRFEKIDQRFEKIDQRFEKINQRFEKMDLHITDLITSMNKKFDQQSELLKSLKLDIARIESKEGKAIEILTRDLLKTTLKLKNIDPDTIESVTLIDKEGAVFYPGYRTDIDIIMENGDVCLIELKATGNADDIAHFLLNVKLYTHIYKKTPTKLIFAAIRINSELIRIAEEQNIKLLWGEILDL
ncbi:MAG: hypothetical protein K9W44_13920 [Candidatus Lokiarchaeota archaeon]|nr:hypothetical protein [Candidatus Harpocratesius repetitus]